MIACSYRSLWLVFALVLAVPAISFNAAAADKVFGEQLMTPAEIAAYKDKIANCRTDAERAEVKAAHHAYMVQRARWKGLVLAHDENANGPTMAEQSMGAMRRNTAPE